MILFALYAVLSWYLAAKWRRTWKGFLSQTVSIMLLLGVMRVFHVLGRADTGEPGRFGSILLLLGFETVVVALVGFVICCIPRSAPSARHCRECHYDLAGLMGCGTEGMGAPGLVRKCPECGTKWDEPGTSGGSPGSGDGLLPILKHPTGAMADRRHRRNPTTRL